MSISSRARPAGAVLLTALAVACTSIQDSAAPVSVEPSPAQSAATTTAAPTSTALPPPTATDDENYSACADGTCEVAIAAPVDIGLGAGSTLTVTRVLPDGIEFELMLTNGGGGSGTLKGSCGTIATFTAIGGGMKSCAPGSGRLPAPEPQAGVFAMQLAGIGGDGAPVLRMVSP